MLYHSQDLTTGREARKEHHETNHRTHPLILAPTHMRRVSGTGQVLRMQPGIMRRMPGEDVIVRKIKSTTTLCIGSLRCFMCAETAILRVTIQDGPCEVKACLCCMCARKPADDILKNIYTK